MHPCSDTSNPPRIHPYIIPCLTRYSGVPGHTAVHEACVSIYSMGYICHQDYRITWPDANHRKLTWVGFSCRRCTRKRGKNQLGKQTLYVLCIYLDKIMLLISNSSIQTTRRGNTSGCILHSLLALLNTNSQTKGKVKGCHLLSHDQLRLCGHHSNEERMK